MSAELTPPLVDYHSTDGDNPHRPHSVNRPEYGLQVVDDPTLEAVILSPYIPHPHRHGLIPKARLKKKSSRSPYFWWIVALAAALVIAIAAGGLAGSLAVENVKKSCNASLSAEVAQTVTATFTTTVTSILSSTTTDTYTSIVTTVSTSTTPDQETCPSLPLCPTVAPPVQTPVPQGPEEDSGSSTLELPPTKVHWGTAQTSVLLPAPADTTYQSSRSKAVYDVKYNVDAAMNDIFGFVAQSFELCMEACSNYSRNTKVLCAGVAWNPRWTNGRISGGDESAFWAENCYLKSSIENEAPPVDGETWLAVRQ